ncbi:thioesterase II family protein [Clostridium estertheticum]|uniref:thioesterase II family protein n=1 Tax=Clostridium estertheticum TaxID=238834 RepID=UPI001C6E68C8|nr:thioesterase domain-containing protein [Clostridium estertheticum]MBW9154390.1 thioesterase [Clostridium estertheticum]WLC85837.1 thioesterase [Clostridium estertheticum]
MILFCLPYAGGSETIYYKWKFFLDPSIELVRLALKGRGKRYSENFYKNIDEAVDDIFENIKDRIANEDYAIYGHSMGSLLAYELYYKISRFKLRKPMHIFLSGYKPPSIIKKTENIYALSDNDFIQKLRDLGGTPVELLNNQVLLQIFLPIIRSDFEMLESYKYVKRENKIKCDVSILNGKQDSISLKEILAWKNHVCSGLYIYNFDGNHFYLNSNVENITDIINDTLENKTHNKVYVHK